MSVLRFLWSPNVYWPLLFLIGFGLREGIALGTGHPEDTLSDTVWRAFNVIPGRTVWQIGILQLLLLMVLTWAYGHLAFGWWRVWRA